MAFEGAFLRPAATETGTVYTSKARGDPVTVAVTRLGEKETQVEIVIGEFVHDVCRVEYPLDPIRTERGTWADGIRITKNGALLFRGGYDPESSFGWYDQNGKPDFFTSVSVSFSGSAPWSDYETTRANALSFALGPELTARGSWGLYALMVFCSVFVALDAAFPAVLFHLRYMCDVRDPEPSDFYLAMQRVGWAVCPVLLLIGYIGALRSLP